MLDWSAFLEGYAIGTFQMVCIDGTILLIIWPLRPFLMPLKRPEVRAKFKLLIGLDLTPEEEAAVKAADEKARAARLAKKGVRT